MKSKLLLTAAGSVGAATITGISTALLVTDPVLAARLTSVAGVFVLASIGLFFIGLAFPKTEAVDQPKAA